MSWEQAWLDRVFWVGVVFVALGLAVFITDMVWDKFNGQGKR